MIPDSELFAQTFAETIALHDLARANPEAAIDAARAIIEALRAGGTLMIFGNGGSAADAQHVAAELVGRFERERRGIAAIALTTDTSILTSVGNDYGYERVFARQIDALGKPGDIALGISTSGRSSNVVAALQAARTIGITTIALTGSDGGAVGEQADVHVNVPSTSAARTQEVHRTLLHVICDLVERALA
jgi:D-sedoheptulose 7-phosphate isomerase